MMRWARHVLWGLGLLGLSCSRGSPGATARMAPLEGSIVARAGDQSVHQKTVARIAGAQDLSPRAALDKAIFDALVSIKARSELSPWTVRVAGRAASARALLEAIQREAVERGPPTDQEVEELTRERWQEVDRPQSAQVTHAVALRPNQGSAESARQVALEIKKAVEGMTEPEAFIQKAQSVPAGEIEIRAERLPPMTADGRSWSPDGTPNDRSSHTFDLDFAHAANQLSKAGEQSSLVETRFGFHVLLLERKLPEHRVALPERRRAFAHEIWSRRARSRTTKLVESLEQAAQVTLARDFDALTAKLLSPE